MDDLIDFNNRMRRIFQDWIAEYQVNVAVVNIVLIILFLLRSVGYFHPYFTITIHVIVIVSIILAILFLGANSNSLIIVSILFLLGAALLDVLNIDVWAERTAMYSFEFFVFGTLLEIIRIKNLFK